MSIEYECLMLLLYATKEMKNSQVFAEFEDIHTV